MKRLFLRIFLTIFLTTVVSVLAAGLILQHHFGREAREKMGEMFHGPISYATRNIERHSPDEIDSVLTSMSQQFGFAVRVTTLSDPLLRDDDLVALSTGKVIGGGYGDEHRMILAPLGHGDSVLVMGPLIAPSGPRVEFVLFILGVVLAIISIAGFILFWPVARRLRHLETAANELGAGNFDARASVDSRDAIGTLGSRFNAMAASIQRMVIGERQLSQAVSHELRTPIARIQFSLEILDEASDAAVRSEHIKAITEDLDDMNRLVAEMLDYSRYSHGNEEVHWEWFDAREVVEELATRNQALQPEIRVETAFASEPGELRTHADLHLFKRAVHNVLANALKHATSRVDVICRSLPKAVQVTVCDDGPGIPVEERARVFEPFARVDKSRNRLSGGTGLGLAIAHRILLLHEGSIRMTDSPSGGAQFVLTWYEMTDEVG